MVQIKKDLTGLQFGRLKVICRADDYITTSGRCVAQWLCECDCEQHNLIVVRGGNLTKTNNPTRSCGCISREKTIQRNKENKKSNIYNLTDYKYGVGFTSNTNKEFYFDLEDYEQIKNYCWSERIDKDGYSSLIAWDCILQKTIKMHYLLGFKKCDHKDRNLLNNRRINLRTATVSENARNRSVQKNNTSGVTGVNWYNQGNKWRAQIGYNKQIIYLGSFNDKEGAIKTRLMAELKYYGIDFAPQRHLFEKYNINEILN